MKNNRSFRDLRRWKSYLRHVAVNLVSEDRIMDAGKYFIRCQEWSVKRDDFFCLTDGGAYEFLIALMKNATNNRQCKQVEYFMNEFFPNMHPCWHHHFRAMGNELVAMRIRCDKQRV